MLSTSSRTTVVVPAYNRADYLAETLESAFAQSVPPLEVIVVDDASHDDTAGVAERFPVTLVRHPENRGLSDARNTGIARARGEFVAFLDSDDLWTPDHLELTTTLLDTYSSADLAFTGTVAFGERTDLRKAVLEPFTPRDCYWDLIAGCFVPIQSVVVRRTVFAQAGMFESGRRIVEDYEWFFRIAQHSHFVSSDQVTAKYRIHPGQLSKSVHRMILGTWDILLRERERLSAGQPSWAARFDEITRSRVAEDVADLAYGGDYRSIVALKRLLTDRGARSLADGIGSSSMLTAVGRSIFNGLPDIATRSLRRLRHATSSSPK